MENIWGKARNYSHVWIQTTLQVQEEKNGGPQPGHDGSQDISHVLGDALGCGKQEGYYRHGAGRGWGVMKHPTAHRTARDKGLSINANSTEVEKPRGTANKTMKDLEPHL